MTITTPAVSMKLEEAIKQERFRDLGQKAVLNIMYSASWLSQQMRKALDPYDISWQQFNLLRILKGQKGKPIALKIITERMIDRTSNTSRLLDKLVKKELVTRTACSTDRRQLEIALSGEGEKVVDAATIRMDKEMHRITNHIDQAELSQLNLFLENVRTLEVPCEH